MIEGSKAEKPTTGRPRRMTREPVRFQPCSEEDDSMCDDSGSLSSGEYYATTYGSPGEQPQVLEATWTTMLREDSTRLATPVHKAEELPHYLRLPTSSEIQNLASRRTTQSTLIPIAGKLAWGNPTERKDFR